MSALYNQGQQKAEVAGVYYMEVQGGYWITDEEFQTLDFRRRMMQQFRLIYLFVYMSGSLCWIGRDTFIFKRKGRKSDSVN